MPRELIDSEVIELLLQHKHFYGHLLQQFRRHAVSGRTSVAGQVITTMAVLISDELQPHLYINEDFYSSGDLGDGKGDHTWGLTQEERIACLEHEILHILNKHLLRVENRNHYVWNLANDLAINQYIKGLPAGGMCPDCNIFVRKTQAGAFRKKCPVCSKALDPEEHVFETLDIKNFKVEGKQVKFEAERASELYYDVLWAAIPQYMIEIGSGVTGKREAAAKSGMGSGSGESDKDGEGGSGGQKDKNSLGDQEGDGGSSGEGDKEKEKEKNAPGDGSYQQKGEAPPKTGAGNNVKVNGVNIPMPFDNHEAWAAGSDNREMAHEKIKEMVQKAVHKVNEKSQGYMPGWLKGLVDDCLEHKTITWKSELRRFYGFREFSHFVSTRKRLNRRFPVVFPGYRVERKAHFVVATDSSGSVDDEEFAKFWREMGTMFSAGIGITHVECDADITHVKAYKRKPPVGKGIKRYGYGGTDFTPVFKLVRDRHYKNHNGETFDLKQKVDGIIYCTDGAGTYPKSIPCPTIWVMTPEHYTNGWNSKLGKIIVMED